MIDGSKHSFEDNIALTKQVVEYAHAHGVVVEGELGQLAGIEDDVKVAAHEASYTRPEEVEEWLISLEKREINLPLILRQEAIELIP